MALASQGQRDVTAVPAPTVDDDPVPFPPTGPLVVSPTGSTV